MAVLGFIHPEMELTQTATSPPVLSWALGILDAPRKMTVIRIRWPLIIICSYLLLFSQLRWVTLTTANAFLVVYLLSNCALYFVDEKRFETFSFHALLIVFDTLCMSASLVVSQSGGTDFYIVCFVTIFLSTICRSFSALLGIAVLFPVLYAYFLLKSGEIGDLTIYLRSSFPFAIAIFYGYFAQTEWLQKLSKEQAEQFAYRKRAEEQARRNLDRISALQEIGSAMTSTLDLEVVLNLFLEKLEALLPYAAAVIRLYNPATGHLDPVASRKFDGSPQKLAQWEKELGLTGVVFQTKAPLVVRNTRTDPHTRHVVSLHAADLVFYLGVPLIVKGKAIGDIVFFTNEEREFGGEEVQFFTALASQAAISIHNSQLYEAIVKANKIKDEFLGIMSHEFRTPLNVVSGYAQLMKEQILGEVNSRQAEVLQKIVNCARDQLTMITDIMDVTKMESESERLVTSEVGLVPFFEDLKSSYWVPPEKDLTLRWDYPCDLPSIKTDREKLKHVLQNLISNAVKFTERGTVTVSARCVSGSKKVMFQVADSGVGIPQEHLPLIFERFHQVDSSNTRKFGGIGMGLYIVKKFTEILGGQVVVESKPGSGSAFTVTLPYEN
jgi:signal transduction histidine kinase